MLQKLQTDDAGNRETRAQRASLYMKTQMKSQLKFALALLDFHSGQLSALYAVGSGMLSDAQKGSRYVTTRHKGHADDEENQGAVSRAIYELQGLRKNANYPEVITPRLEQQANRLAARLEKFKR